MHRLVHSQPFNHQQTLRSGTRSHSPSHHAPRGSDRGVDRSTASQPSPLIASLSKELKQAKQTLKIQSQALIKERQLQHQLLRRIRELERELERGDQHPVQRDSHNSSLPPALDLPWQKVPRTRSLRKQSGRKPGAQFGHRGTTLRQVARPDQLIVHSPESCMQCGAHLQHSTLTTSVRRQVFDISEGRVQVTTAPRRVSPLPDLRHDNKGQVPSRRACSGPIWTRGVRTLRLSAPLSTAADQ